MLTSKMFSNERDDDRDFAELLEQSFEFDNLKRGDIREAEILEIRDNEIVVDVGVKRDGFVASQDIERLDPKFLKSLHVGDTVPVYVLNPSDRDGNLLVSINLGLEGHDWLKAQQLLESGDMVEAEVIGYNRGGLLVKFGRLEGFVPSSHAMDLEQGLAGTDRREAMDDLIGSKIGLKVIEVNQGRRRLILSQREAQREWRSKQKERLLDNLKVSDVVMGRVTGIRDFGVFVDIGGADGLIHVSELAWHRVPHPRDVVQVGDEIQVYVLELDQDHQRIALSLRRTQSDPWEIVHNSYNIGDVVEGTVSNVVDFGAFVVLNDGIEGLLHITEMADGTLTEPHSYLKRGDKVTVKIVRIEPDRKRIGFTQAGLNIARPTDEPGEGPAEAPRDSAENTDEASMSAYDEMDSELETMESTDEGGEATAEAPTDSAENTDEASMSAYDEMDSEPEDMESTDQEDFETADVELEDEPETDDDVEEDDED